MQYSYDCHLYYSTTRWKIKFWSQCNTKLKVIFRLFKLDVYSPPDCCSILQSRDQCFFAGLTILARAFIYPGRHEKQHIATIALLGACLSHRAPFRSRQASETAALSSPNALLYGHERAIALRSSYQSNVLPTASLENSNMANFA